mmetsp:Transcript_38910/g.115760  ORF Transcript_38910/g.115760 Transcript_38910/m.115760 type:complete len:209 (+) Transcript_38910:1072-1698(+)
MDCVKRSWPARASRLAQRNVALDRHMRPRPHGMEFVCATSRTWTCLPTSFGSCPLMERSASMNTAMMLRLILLLIARSRKLSNRLSLTLWNISTVLMKLAAASSLRVPTQRCSTLTLAHIHLSPAPTLQLEELQRAWALRHQNLTLSLEWSRLIRHVLVLAHTPLKSLGSWPKSCVRLAANMARRLAGRGASDGSTWWHSGMCHASTA